MELRSTRTGQCGLNETVRLTDGGPLFPKADVQNVRVGVELNDRFWPKADVRVHET